MITIATLLYLAAAVLVASVLVSLVQVARGPSARHRLLVVVLLGTTGTAVLALLAEASGITALRDGALVLIALATLVVAVRVRAEERPTGPTPGPPGGDR